MDEYEFQATLRGRVDAAVNYNDQELTQHRLKATDYYLGEPFGDEEEGRSQVVMTEVRDTIEFIMPSLMRIFTQSNDFARFAPRQPEDVPFADQATDYVNYVLSVDNPGFQIMHNAMKDGLLYKLGVVKAYWHDDEEVMEEEFEGLSAEEAMQLLDDPDVEVVSQVVEGEDELDENGEALPPTLNLKIKRTRKAGRVVLENVPPEEFLFDSRAKSLEDADFVCHRHAATVSDLLEAGYDRQTVEDAAGYSEDTENEDELTRRFQDIESGRPVCRAQ